MSSMTDNQPAAAVRRVGVRGFIAAWDPLVLLSIAAAYACAGILLRSGALTVVTAWLLR